MDFHLLRLTGIVLVLLTVFGSAQPTNAQSIPNPHIYLTRIEPVAINGKDYVRYYYDVFNKDDFPPELFASAPSLPPCGIKTKASRTWIDLYDQSGTRLNGFCDLTSLKDLANLWFAQEKGVVPPSWIYIEFNDRQTKKKYKSNLAETSQ